MVKKLKDLDDDKEKELQITLTEKCEPIEKNLKNSFELRKKVDSVFK